MSTIEPTTISIILSIVLGILIMFLTFLIIYRCFNDKDDDYKKSKNLEYKIEKLTKDLKHLDITLMVSNDYIRFLERKIKEYERRTNNKIN